MKSEVFGNLSLPDMKLASGKTLREARVAYSMSGRASADGSNVIVLCHALTGSHHVTGDPVEYLPDAWWSSLVRPGGVLDINKFCVICCNNLCSPYGSSAPNDIEPGTRRPWGMRFPLVTPRDIAMSQKLALDALGIHKIAGVIGGSLGGMIALEWMAQFGDMLSFGVDMAAPLRLYPQAIAFNEVQRRAITSDPEWQGGDYDPHRQPLNGLHNARMLAMITYRSEQSFIKKHMRESIGTDEWGGKFGIENYLMHHGESLSKRFDANCYLYLTRAMDLHDISSGRGDAEAAFDLMRKKHLLTVGINSDILFPSWQIKEVTDAALDVGVYAAYKEIQSDVGHDAFLVENDQVGEILSDFFNEINL
ncbi:homoserine O-acetyltransferase [Synergistales bacterium]|nr:homoserine O-acetyltransferase [Synergistales bacterium]